ncbi:MAG: hypothetical protein WC867_06330 [Candidatus Pacearchaeota archaeon]
MILLTIISILLVAIILMVIIYYLFTMNQRLKKRIDIEKSKILFYQNQIEQIKRSTLSSKEVDRLNKIARDFFNERYGLKYSMTYLELADRFRKRGKEKQAEFCDLMNKIIYAGRELNSVDLSNATKLFSEIAENPLLNSL